MTYIADLDPNSIENERAEAAHEWAVSEFGDDYADREADPERFVSEADYFAPTEQERADLQVARDWEAFGGFHNP